MRVFILFIKLSVLILTVFSAAAQPPVHDISNFQISHYTTENGLPQNTISSSIIPDQDGFIWIGTHAGLIRYDGVKFKNIPEFKNKRIKGVYEENGCAFVIQQNATLNDGWGKVFNSCTNKFENQSDGNRFFNFLVKNKLYPTTYATGAGIYKSGKLFWFLDNDSITYAEALKNKPEKTYRWYKKPISVYPGKDMRVGKYGYINGQLYLFHLSKKTGKLHATRLSFNEKEKIIEEEIPVSGIPHIKSEECTFTSSAWPENFKYFYLFINNNLYRIEENGKKLESKLLISNTASLEKEMYSGKNWRILSLHSNEKGDLIYIGTSSNGFFELKRKDFHSLFTDDSLYAHLEADSGKVIISPGRYELKFLDRKKTPSVHLFYLKRPENKINILDQHNPRTPLLRDSKSNIWTYKNGVLLKINLESGEQEILLRDSSSFILALTEGKDGKIWLGGTERFGYLKDGRYTSLKHYLDYNYKNIKYLAEDLSGNIFIAGAGLTIFNPDTKKLTWVLAEDIVTRAVYIDNDNTAWIGTYGSGLYRYKSRVLTRLPNDRNNYLNFAHCFLEDENGFLWIPSNQGLFKAKRETLNAFADGHTEEVYYHYYNSSTGLATNEFNGGCMPCGIQLSDGKFSFPSVKGLVQFDPLNIPSRIPENPIFFDNFTLNGQDFSFKSNTKLPPDFKNLIFSATTAFFGNEENLQMSYRVKNFSDKWLPAKRNKELQITSLVPGSYVLEMRYPKSFDTNDYEMSSIPFEVEPYFYQEYWFRILSALGIFGFLYLAYRFRIRNIKKEKQRLEEKVSEKTESLQKTLTELEKDNLLKHKLISIITHNINGPIKFIGTFSKDIERKIDSLNPDKLRQRLQTIQHTSKELHELTSNILIWVLSQKKELQPEFTEMNLAETIEEILPVYKKLLDEKSIKVFTEIDANNIRSDRNYLKIIFQNLIHNAAKFTNPEGTIMIKSQTTPKQIIVQIENTGIRISDERKNQILNEITYPSFTGTKGERGQGLGLLIVKELLFKLNGQLVIKNKGEKTIFSIEIPNIISD